MESQVCLMPVSQVVVERKNQKILNRLSSQFRDGRRFCFHLCIRTGTQKTGLPSHGDYLIEIKFDQDELSTVFSELRYLRNCTNWV